MLGVYTTVEAFFGTFATLRRPSQLERNANYHLFKNGIKPMWEDPANANGGKWTITLRGTNPALLDRSWMWLVLALIGEELDENDSITGAVCSTRAKGDRIALWVRHKNEVDVVNRLGRRLVHLLDVEKEPGVSLEFQFMMGQPTAPARYISIHNPPVAGTPGGQQHGGSPAGGSRSGYGRRGSEQLGPAPGAYGQHQNQYGGGIGLGLGGPIGRATHSPGSGVVGLPGPGALGVGGGVGLGGLIGRTHSPGPPAGTGGSGTLSGGVPLGHKAAAIPEPKRSGPGGNGAA